MQKLTTYIKHPEQLDTATIDELTQMVERYPYFQAARLLLIRALYQQQSEQFGTELRKAALYVPDRCQLFELIEGDKYKPSHQQQQTKKSSTPEPQPVDRTQSLIEGFLSQQPEEQKRRTKKTSATDDYITYLLQLEDALPKDSKPSEKPIHQVPLSPSAQQTLTSVDNEVYDEDDLVPLGLEENEENTPSETYFTETLARIYIKQGKYAKAIEIIRRISLIYPKKNRYFADQIRFLEKLLINEQAK